MRNYKHPKLSNFDDALETGAKLLGVNKDFYSEMTERSVESDTAIIAYSAATTGNPKGAMLSHGNIIAAAQNPMTPTRRKKMMIIYPFYLLLGFMNK